MWFLSELEIQCGIREVDARAYCAENNIRLGLYRGSDGRYLGHGLPDDIVDKLLSEVKE